MRGFVKPGDLVFDVGSHVGDRIAAFRRLGARVVACEPQPALVKTLRLIYGRDRNVTIEPVAVGAAPGEIELKINLDNPTVSTASRDFVKASEGAPGWEGQSWGKSVKVAMTTLDALIGKHGMPVFMKIDVEGFEAEALAGLTQPVAGALVRVHHDPARRRARLPQALRGAGVRPLQCGAWARARRWCTPTGRAPRRSAAGSPRCRWRRIPGMCMRRASSSPRSCCWRPPRSRPTTSRSTCRTPASRRCAPRRTTSISSSRRPRCASFKVEAVHPNYIGTIVVDRSAFDLHNCPDLAAAPFITEKPQRITIFETPTGS